MANREAARAGDGSGKTAVIERLRSFLRRADERALERAIRRRHGSFADTTYYRYPPTTGGADTGGAGGIGGGDCGGGGGGSC